MKSNGEGEIIKFEFKELKVFSKDIFEFQEDEVEFVSPILESYKKILIEVSSK
jgi:hypothetical protein